MKNLQFKLDMIASAIGCIGILLAAYAFHTATAEALFVGALLAVISLVMMSSSGIIARFIKGETNEENNSD